MTAGRETVVHVAGWASDRCGGTLVSFGLGSCVAIMVHDPVAQIGAMAHVLLPSRSLSLDTTRPAKFPDTAVPLLVDRLIAMGGDPRRFIAKLAGGARMFGQLLPAGSVHMGERNVIAARTALRAAGIPIVAEAVGGSSGRSVWFRAADGAAVIRSVGQREQTL